MISKVCDREDIIDSNIREVKVTSPDYAQCDEGKASSSPACQQ